MLLAFSIVKATFMNLLVSTGVRRRMVSFNVVGLQWLSRLSDRLPPLRPRVRALYRTSDRTWEEFVNTLPKVVTGFLPVLRFPPTGKVDRVG